jgi:pyridoxamine 5'-phosphate oxidase
MAGMTDPLTLFREWFAEASDASPLRHPGAVCVSTVDADGVPAGRFVDLKAVTDAGFIFCTQLDSDKGLALAVHPGVALTFWWDHMERQVRVAGNAQRISDAEADVFFEARPRAAQLVSCASRQSAPLPDPALLEARLTALQDEYAGAPIARPQNWGGYLVTPVRIEFLSFKQNRMHERLLFRRDGSVWRQEWLQP